MWKSSIERSHSKISNFKLTILSRYKNININCLFKINKSKMEEVDPSIEEKQNYLRENILNRGYDVNAFISFLLEKRGEGGDDVANWSLTDLKAVVPEFIALNDQNKLINFCKIIQASSAIDSHVEPIPSDMPGYSDKVIMASGSFTQGSSIELSCDGPLRSPYIAYFQGSLSYDYGKIAIINILNKFIGDEDE